MFGIYDKRENEFYDHCSYPTWQAALEAANSVSARCAIANGLRFVARKRPVDGAKGAWKLREQARFDNGDYKPLPWAELPWFKENVPADHFAHLSSDGMRVSFTPDEAKGEADRQLVVSPGVYLSRFFAGVLTVAQINDYARRFASSVVSEGDETVNVTITNDPDEIVRVYASSPRSCMKRSDSVRVYGGPNSDLALAYIDVLDAKLARELDMSPVRYDARAIVWPARKIYCRVYPSEESGYFRQEYATEAQRDYARRAAEKLRHALEERGYTRNTNFSGARIDAIHSRGSEYVMPYLDTSPQRVELQGSSFVIGDEGVEANSTDGLISLDDDDDEDYVSCRNCDDDVHDDDAVEVYIASNPMRSAYWCPSCASNNAFRCDRTGSHYSDSEFTAIYMEDTYETLCEERASRFHHYYYCARTDEYYRRASSGANVATAPDETEWWCFDAIEDEAFFCAYTARYYDRDSFVPVSFGDAVYEREAFRAHIEPGAIEGDYLRCWPRAEQLALLDECAQAA